jgi:hypothetical protein
MKGVAVAVAGQLGQRLLDIWAASLLVVRGLVMDIGQPGRAFADHAVSCHVDD